MAGLIRVEKEVLQKNIFGAFFVGPDSWHMKRVDAIGKYPVRLGRIRKGIAIQFEEVEGASFIEARLPYLHSLHIRIWDYQDHRQIDEELLGKMGGMNIGAYQIESLGGKQMYLGGRIRMFSLEAAEEATRRAKRVRSLR